MLDERGLSRLKWRCRRGLLENDLFIERFFSRHAATLTEAQAEGMNELMALADNDLLDLLLARRQPEGEALGGQAVRVLHLMRTPALPLPHAALSDTRTTGRHEPALVETNRPPIR